MTDSLFPSVEAHVIDTNLFVAFERHDTVDLLEPFVFGLGRRSGKITTHLL